MSSETEFMRGGKGTRRSGVAIMGQLIRLVCPLMPVMCLSVLLGTVGHLCAISLTILAAARLASLAFSLSAPGGMIGMALSATAGRFAAALVIIAVMRGVLHYGEQYCNHFIAFRLLAIVRHRVFAKLRELCPAKLETRDKGNLIQILTSDIEMLEVFYAHTISPIAIAVIVCTVMVVFLSGWTIAAGLIALCAYAVVGVVIPIFIGKREGGPGMEYRNALGNLNGYVLDSLYGADETIQYRDGRKRLEAISEKSRALSRNQEAMSREEALQRGLTNACVLAFSVLMLLATLMEYRAGSLSFLGMVICVTGMMGSFGPVIALSNLGNSLSQTLAAGERVLSLLEETPEVREVTVGEEPVFGTGSPAAALRHVSFSYMDRADRRVFQNRVEPLSGRNMKTQSSEGGKLSETGSLENEADEAVLRDVFCDIPKGKVFGILGPSGSGKSTILKLLMRFWDVENGDVEVGSRDVRTLKTAALRHYESYVTQDTWLFHDTIAANIALGKPEATREEIERAAEKASFAEFVSSLPKGYDTEVGELGDTLSGGERQRIGIARAFLADSPLLLMDEPTSSLDALNEGIILRSIREESSRTVVLVSHRKSTLRIADEVMEMNRTRKS